ncbi:MAG: peptidoglycan-binding domain-containing protein [Pseudomonadota bacterium]
MERQSDRQVLDTAASWVRSWCLVVLLAAALTPGLAVGDTPSAEQIRRAQVALADAGHDPGDPDGVMGPQTRTAIFSYQRAADLPSTGALDTATLTSLHAQGALLGDGAGAQGREGAQPALSGRRLGARAAPAGDQQRLSGSRLPGRAIPGDRRHHRAPSSAGAGASTDDTPSLIDALPFPFEVSDQEPGSEPASRRGPVTRRPGEPSGPLGRGEDARAPVGGDGRFMTLPSLSLPTVEDLRALGVPAFPIPDWLTPWRLVLIVVGLALFSALSGRMAARRRHPGARRRPHRRDPDDVMQDPPLPRDLPRGLRPALQSGMAGGGPRGG